MGQKKPTNPFYVALLPVGVAFVLTACAFVVMMLRGNDPYPTDQARLIQLMERHGIVMMTVEVAILAILTVAAIATDGFWMRRLEAAEARPAHGEKLP